MRVLSIGTDRSVFDPQSTARARQQAYAKALGELDLIVLTRETREIVRDGTLTIVPTNSKSRLSYVLDVLRSVQTLSRPDVITVQDPFEIGPIGVRIARRFGIPLHVQLHTDPSAMGGIRGIIRRAIARRVLAHAARIRVVSTRAAATVKKLTSSKAPITILPIFVDTMHFATASVPAGLEARFVAFSQKILYVGRLEREKNCALAIDAFKDAAPNDACLIVVGDGRERSALERLAVQSGISGRVFFEGSKDAAPYYALADLMLVPSKYEGYGLVIVEALAAGKPVLATDVGIAREAGAIVADEAHYTSALKEWFARGPKTGTLLHYPYTSFQQYVDAYAADLRACL